MNNPTDEEKAAYLKSKGWHHNPDGTRWVHIRLHAEMNTPGLGIAFMIQERWDREAAGVVADEQLEKDIACLRFNAQIGSAFDGAVARTILHLLKR